MLYGAKEGVLRCGEAEMDYITFGSGAKPLVMIQGLNTRGIHGAADSLAFLYRMFAKEYTVYLFDRRRVLPEAVTVRQLAEDVARAMDALGLQNADILGVSQGGMIAQYLALDRPDLVHKLVLAVTLCRNNPTVVEVFGRWVAMTEQGAYKALIADMAEAMYSEAYLKKYRPMLPLLTAVQKPRDPERFLTLAKACLTCDTYEELPRITCPVLVIGGGRDRIVGADAARELAEVLGCPCRVYEELGHAAYEEAPDFNQTVYDFLTSD